MSTSARDIANAIHDTGLSDAKIAALLGVGREHISRLRNGKRGASTELEEALTTLFTQLTSGNNGPTEPLTTKAPKATKIPALNIEAEAEEETGEDGFSKTEIFIVASILGVFVVLLVIPPSIRWYKSRNKNEQDTTGL